MEYGAKAHLGALQGSRGARLETAGTLEVVVAPTYGKQMRTISFVYWYFLEYKNIPPRDPSGHIREEEIRMAFMITRINIEAAENGTPLAHYSDTDKLLHLIYREQGLVYKQTGFLSSIYGFLITRIYRFLEFLGI